MMDALRHICLKHRVFLTREAIDLGLEQKHLTRAVRDGTLHRVRHGAYTFGDTWRSLDSSQRHLVTAGAVLRSARTPVLLSHVSAALEYGLPLWDLPFGEVHTTRLGGKAGRREAGIRHHQGLLLSGDTHELNGIPVTSPARTAVDLTTLTDAEHALVPINAMLHDGLLTLEDFRARLAGVEHWPDTLAAHVVKQLANPAVESPGESRTDYLLWATGLPRPQAQFEICDHTGAVIARLDFAWPEHGVFLEFDGRIKYQGLLREGESVTDVVLREKRREERVCEITGWRCIRITWSDLSAPDRLAARVSALLAVGPSRAV